jgi:hypothetical protein
MPVKLSAKAFAEFVLAGPGDKAQIVWKMLHPKSVEVRVITQYYSAAIKIIRIYHSKENDPRYLAGQTGSLEKLLDGATTPQARARLRNNLRALRAYMELYGDRKRKIIARPRIYHSSGMVRISASPDFAVEEGGKTKLVKLGVTKKKENPKLIRILLRVMYQAAAQGKLAVEPEDILYFDVVSAARIRGSYSDADLKTIIDNGCETLAKMC